MRISNLWSSRHVLLYYAGRILGRKPAKKLIPKLPDSNVRPKIQPVPRQRSDILYLELEVLDEGKWRTLAGSRILAIPVVRIPDDSFPSGMRYIPSLPLYQKKGYVWRIVEFRDYPASRFLAIRVPENWNSKLWFQYYRLRIPNDLLGIKWKPEGKR